MKKSPIQYIDIYPEYARSSRWFTPVFSKETAEYLGYQKLWPTRELVVVLSGIVIFIPLLFLLAIILAI